MWEVTAVEPLEGRVVTGTASASRRNRRPRLVDNQYDCQP